ncbi:MAG: C25 family cysteine peptidase [Cytophagaceae bacterium]
MLRKTFLFFFILFSCCYLVSGQILGNEWIVPGQRYFKIPVAESGIYALRQQDLLSAGVPLGTLSTRQLQIFHRGVEQAIYVSGELNSDFSFDNNDTLIFYGIKNDGFLDSMLYRNPSFQPHKFYNLYSDTTAFFLTWSNSPNGKRMSFNLSSSGSPESFHIEDALMLFSESYEKGHVYSIETTLSTWDRGEGWTSGGIIKYINSAPAIRTYTIDVNNLVAGQNPVLEMVLAGGNQQYHVVDILLGDPAAPKAVFSLDTFLNHTTQYFIREISNSHFDGNQLRVSIRVKGFGQAQDVVSVNYIRLKYPQSVSMNGRQERWLEFPAKANAFVSVSGSSSIPGVPRVYDISDRSNIRILSSSGSGSLNFQIANNTNRNSRVFVSSPATYKFSPRIFEVSMTPYSTTSEYIIISHPKLMSKANEYASYRQSVPGGKYSVLVADILKLYNLFTYGEKSPAAIRQFMAHQLANGDPQYLFIIGKGLEINYNGLGPYYRHNPSLYINHPDRLQRVEDLVPAAGLPGSDLIFTMGLGGASTHVTKVATGRIPARTPEDVDAYLNKIREHEDPTQNPNAMWRKRLVHLSGGTDLGQNQMFRNHMNKLKAIAEGHFFGGKVKSFSKNSTNYSQVINISDDINSGVSYVTFYGHSAPFTSDVDIGFVSFPVYGYNNKGKYPMLFLNGCSSVNIYGTLYSFAEDWIQTPNKGAILCLGHTDAGYPYQLERYSEIMYRRLFTDTSNMHHPVGHLQLGVISQFISGFSDEVSIATVQQMALIGDPGARVYAPGFNHFNKSVTDYAISNTSIFVKSFTGDKVTASTDSFAIGIVIQNPGITNKDSFEVCISRTIGAAKVIEYSGQKFAPVLNTDTIYFKIKNNESDLFGLNRFDIFIDCKDSIPEIDNVINNRASLEYFMPQSGVICLFPKEYSVVHHQPVNFIAQSTDILEKPKNYFIEIDTSYLFNSPFRKSNVIMGSSIIKWPNVNLLEATLANDSIVYYWRVRPAEIPSGADTVWANSSFIYINKSPDGWSQSEFPQFLKDDLWHIERDLDAKKWFFEKTETTLEVHTSGPVFDNINPDMPPTQANQTYIKLNGLPIVFAGMIWLNCFEDVIIAMTFDRITGQPYINKNIFSCGRNRHIVNSIHTTQTSILKKYLDEVKPGDYVLMVSLGKLTFADWDSETKEKFKSALGSKFIDSLANDDGFLIFGKKGATEPMFEKYSKGPILFDTLLNGSYTTGKITSTLIGPAYEWGTLFRNFTAIDHDNYQLKLIRYNTNGNSDTLNIPQKDSLDLAFIDADMYPYLKLHAVVTDTSENIFPPQLNRWQVIYSPVPEGTLDPITAGIEQYNIAKKKEGEKTKLSFVFSNITDLDFKDTVRVRYIIRNMDRGKTDTSMVKLGKLPANGTINFEHEINTKEFGGRNSFQVFVNPRLQREQYYHNNALELGFDVDVDRINPLLDVLFDGAHIMDGDIVSPSPLITIVINDENKLLLIEDTTGIQIFLKRPGAQIEEKIYLSDKDIIRYGQVGGRSNTFTVEYNPKNLPDGIYELIVQGTDASKNKSGVNFYRIKFQVINQSTITHFYPYPNPFSSSTRFVFTLTGNELPEDLKIQIMTVTGRVVREITRQELGPLRIGHNKSEYAWDGTDEFGDRLANGVYLYKVIIKNKGDNFKHNSTSGDKAFKNNIGKLYILR